MLLDFNKLIEKYGLKIKGVLHVGAHHGQEYETYANKDIRPMLFFEPLKENFEKLKSSVQHAPFVYLHNYALGNKEGKIKMNVEHANQGQSSSILNPKKHLDYYPDITFTSTESVQIKKLDSVVFTRENINFICMDVQGYELEVLKGAKKTLEHIDYIYTEVNRDELYENCATVNQLDSFLIDFKRVETFWTDQDWGDALYIRRDLLENRVVYKGNNSIVKVPFDFQITTPQKYPPHSTQKFEEWFLNYYIDKKIDTDRLYLPIFWTSYYVHHNYGNDKKALARLQKYIDTLDKNKKYFTILQYDDGILNDISGVDIKVFSSGCAKPEYFPIPLICTPHHFENKPKDIVASFVGRRDTHNIRSSLFEIDKPDFVIKEALGLDSFRDIMSRSHFSLCPRGYGVTSFRICEALEAGSVPVYISDYFWEPFNIPFSKYAITVALHEVRKLPLFTPALSLDIYLNLFESGKQIYNQYFTYSGCANEIINTLKLEV